MTSSNLISSARWRAVFAWIAWAGLAVSLLSAFRYAYMPYGPHGYHAAEAGELAIVIAWLATVAWAALDAGYRGRSSFWWGLFTLITWPVALLFYLRTRRDVPLVCLRCGREFARSAQTCPSCGQPTLWGALVSTVKHTQRAVENTAVNGPSAQALHTTKHMAIALGLCIVAGWVVAAIHWPLAAFVRVIWMLAVPAFWVVLPWWVYLDATWRRMDAVPWAILTLATNVFGLVTYLVVRYPDPKSCPQCGAYLTSELKRCPYCGSEAEISCPRCQAPVQTDWVYCPSCAAQLTAVRTPGPKVEGRPVQQTPSIAVKGSVCDAVTGAPIASAEVKIDSRSGGRSTVTDDQGRFVISGLEPRPYVLVASAEGYAPDAKPFTPNPSGSTRLDFSLSRGRG